MILLSTSSLQGYGLHRVFSFVKEAQFDGLDLALTKLNFDIWDENYIKKLSDFFAVPVLSITAPSRGLNEKMVDKIMEIAIKLGAQVVNFSPPHFSDKNTTRFTKYLPKIKKDTHISISIQNVEPKFIFFIIPEYGNSTLDEIKKVTGDTTLDISSIDDILKAQKILGSSIKNIFLSDKHGTKIGVLPGQAGGGISTLPLESFLMKLKTSGYNGFITLTVNPSELGVGNWERVLQNLGNVKNYYEKYFLHFK